MPMVVIPSGYRLPVKEDYDAVALGVKNFLHYFYLHHGVMKEYAEDDKKSLTIACCYLCNKQAESIPLTEEEQDLLTKLQDLKAYGVELEVVSIEKPTPLKPIVNH